MAIIEKIKQMQAQGMSEEAITRSLQEQGHTPNEIYEGISQSKIKSAISAEEPSQPTTPMQRGNYQSSSKMQPSIIESQQAPPQPTAPMQGQYKTQLPQQYQNQKQVSAPVYGDYQEGYSTPQYQEQEYPDQGQYYGQDYATGYEQNQEGYGDYGGYSQGISPELVNEIAEQVVAEKVSDMINTITNLVEFKTKIEAKIENINTRLERAETGLDQLQSAVIKKVGSYVQNVQDIKTEMRLMQNSFSKALPGIAQKRNKSPSKRKTSSKRKSTKKKR